MSIFFSFCGGVALPPTGRSLKYIFQYKQCNAEFYTYCHNLFFPGVGVPKCKKAGRQDWGRRRRNLKKHSLLEKKKSQKKKKTRIIEEKAQENESQTYKPNSLSEL